MNTGSAQDQLLAEQRAYYRALAPDYLDQGLDLRGGAELTDALDAFQPTGSVLELACGPGTWTRQLLRQASDVTAVDASPEMLAIATSRVPSGDADGRLVLLGSRKPGRGRFARLTADLWGAVVTHRDLEVRSDPPYLLSTRLS
jgi:SAM-dependent methyltransferase